MVDNRFIFSNFGCKDTANFPIKQKEYQQKLELIENLPHMGDKFCGYLQAIFTDSQFTVLFLRGYPRVEIDFYLYLYTYLYIFKCILTLSVQVWGEGARKINCEL